METEEPRRLEGPFTNDHEPPSLADDGLEYFGGGARRPLVNVRDLWQHRELFAMLAMRDLKVRYRQTIIGVAWVVLHPLAMGTIFLAFFVLLGQQPAPGDVPYPLVLLSGLLIWQLFASILSQSSNSLVANQHLIGKVYFPRLILPLATAVPNIVDFAVASLLPIGLMVYYGIAPSWPIVLAPAYVMLAVAAALALGIWVAALNAMYRDANFVVTLVLQLGFFVSPVVYATRTLIPEAWRDVLALNPMVGAIEGFRWGLLGREDPPIESSLIALAVTGFVLVTGLMYFRRVEGVLADRI